MCVATTFVCISNYISCIIFTQSLITHTRLPCFHSPSSLSNIYISFTKQHFVFVYIFLLYTKRALACTLCLILVQYTIKFWKVYCVSSIYKNSSKFYCLFGILDNCISVYQKYVRSFYEMSISLCGREKVRKPKYCKLLHCSTNVIHNIQVFGENIFQCFLWYYS